MRVSGSQRDCQQIAATTRACPLLPAVCDVLKEMEGAIDSVHDEFFTACTMPWGGGALQLKMEAAGLCTNAA